MAEESPEGPSEGLQAVLDVFQTVSGRFVEGKDRVPTTIQFTGFTTPTNDIYAGLSNVFLPSKFTTSIAYIITLIRSSNPANNVTDQLVTFYVQKPDGTLTVSFSGTGVYCHELESIVTSYKDSYRVIAGIADEYVGSLAAAAPPPSIS